MKNFNKVIAIILIITVLTGSIFYYFSQYDVFGWRFDFQIKKIETKNYKGLAPNIAFKYPVIFEIDSDNDSKYGSEYVVGIKLKTDSRTGCDIRINGPVLDYSKSVNELADTVTKEISKNAKDFRMVQKEKITVDGQDAFRVVFSFLDPIGVRVQLEQVFVVNNDVNYFIICGTGESQYDFFRKDFGAFFNSIDFDVTEDDFVG